MDVFDIQALSATAPATTLQRQPILTGAKAKPRPAPIYKDKRVEEYWAFLKSVPDHQNDLVPSPSRCPSLMSRGTLSSRNSSTRSTRSLIWDSVEDAELPMGFVCRMSGSGVFSLPGTDAHNLSAPSSEQRVATTGCPVKTCDQHLKAFTRPEYRMRHIYKHFSGVLECGFCDKVSFSPSCNRVDIFLTHLLKKHGAGEQFPTSNPHPEALDTNLYDRNTTVPAVATCPICTEPFTAPGYYEHLSGCILREITRNEDAHARDRMSHDEYEEPSETNELPMVEGQAPEPTPSVEDGQDPFEYSCFLSRPGAPELECDDVAELTASSRCLSLTSSNAVESSEEETDWTEEQTSRESSPGLSQVPRRLSPAKRRVVENIMQEFQRLFNESLRMHTAGGHASRSSSGSYGGWSSNASTYSASSLASRKRSLSGGGATPPDDDDSNKRRRPYIKADGKKPVSDLRFACPYYKRNPGRHQTFTSCRDPGFTTVARLKQVLCE